MGIEGRDERRGEGRGIDEGGALSMNIGRRRDRGGGGRDHEQVMQCVESQSCRDFVEWDAKYSREVWWKG